MTADADGWIEHDGKGMPVDGKKLVHVRTWLRSEHGPDRADCFIWEDMGSVSITHYRIVGEASISPAIIGYVNSTNLNDETFTVRKTAAGLYTLPVYADAMMAERSKK